MKKEEIIYLLDRAVSFLELDEDLDVEEIHGYLLGTVKTILELDNFKKEEF